jgi:long-chain acyl-CoA synthetase
MPSSEGIFQPETRHAEPLAADVSHAHASGFGRLERIFEVTSSPMPSCWADIAEGRLEASTYGAWLVGSTLAPGLSWKSGLAADVINPNVKTLADLPFNIAERFPERAILRHSVGDAFLNTSGHDFLEHIRDLSLGLGELGLAAGDRVAVIAESRPEWCITDLAVLTAGDVTVPVYPTLTSGQVRYILNDCAAKVAVVSNRVQVEKIAAVRGQLSGIATIVVMDADGEAWPEGVMTLADVVTRGHQRFITGAAEARLFKERATAIARDAVATIIYTSGTTGDPKGVMLTHENVLSNVEAAVGVLGVSDEDVALSFLPLSHAFERMVLYLYLYAGATVVFAESPETLARDMVKVRPTLMTAVPRVFEKLYGRIHEKVAHAPSIRQAIFRWAVDVGRRRSAAVRNGRPVGALLALQDRLADTLVFHKIREATGGRLRVLVSGSAPLPRTIAEFFDAIGLTIIEGYGLTEASPALTVNPLDRPKFGTVGRALPQVELRVGEDGEILARGPNVMRGYYNRPETTRAVLEADGWLHTGDIGTLDREGYLTITDRKKDLIITSSGKSIAPQPIENALRRHALIAEAILLGDRRTFIAALLVPDFPALERQLAAVGGTRDALVARADVVALFQAAVDAVNATLAPFETIKRFALLPSEFTIAGGEFTPTMKVKRRVVEERWRAVIETLYEERT